MWYIKSSSVDPLQLLELAVDQVLETRPVVNPFHCLLSLPPHWQEDALPHKRAFVGVMLFGAGHRCQGPVDKSDDLTDVKRFRQTS